jgi:hypothetical protein
MTTIHSLMIPFRFALNYHLVQLGMVTEILQRESGMRKVLRRWHHSLSPVRKFVRVEASKEMLLDECWFHYHYLLLGNVSPFALRSDSEDEGGTRQEENYDHATLHRKETNRSRCPAKSLET